MSITVYIVNFSTIWTSVSFCVNFYQFVAYFLFKKVTLAGVACGMCHIDDLFNGWHATELRARHSGGKERRQRIPKWNHWIANETTLEASSGNYQQNHCKISLYFFLCTSKTTRKKRWQHWSEQQQQQQRKRNNFHWHVWEVGERER